MAATAEPMDDEFAVAGPVPLARLEAKRPFVTALMSREMGYRRGISRNSLKPVTIPPKALLTRTLYYHTNYLTSGLNDKL